jgi:hypothetical protein
MAHQGKLVRAWYAVCPKCGRTTVELVGPWDERQRVVLGWRYSLCEACEEQLERQAGEHGGDEPGD